MKEFNLFHTITFSNAASLVLQTIYLEINVDSSGAVLKFNIRV